jgi:curved DNA-binding protein CbpA
MKGTGNGRARMSREEALAVLGLAPEASTQEINIAYRRLGQLLDPQLGGTPYLSMKINEAKNVLLGD